MFQVFHRRARQRGSGLCRVTTVWILVGQSVILVTIGTEALQFSLREKNGCSPLAVAVSSPLTGSPQLETGVVPFTVQWCKTVEEEQALLSMGQVVPLSSGMLLETSSRNGVCKGDLGCDVSKPSGSLADKPKGNASGVSWDITGGDPPSSMWSVKEVIRDFLLHRSKLQCSTSCVLTDKPGVWTDGSSCFFPLKDSFAKAGATVQTEALAQSVSLSLVRSTEARELELESGARELELESGIIVE